MGSPDQGRAAPGAAGTIGDALEQAERFSLDAECVLKCLCAAHCFRTTNCSRAVLLVSPVSIRAVHGLVQVCWGHIAGTPRPRAMASAPQQLARGAPAPAPAPRARHRELPPPASSRAPSAFLCSSNSAPPNSLKGSKG